MSTAPQAFFDAYIQAALWSSTGDDDEPLDREYGPEDIDGATLDKMLADCTAFWSTNETTLESCDQHADDHFGCGLEAQAGHDFWLTRCGHGAGFWDGDWPEPQATRLDEAAKRFGNVDLYVGDDGKIHA